jgi:uncharacterized protein involved in response to NO
MSTLLLGALSCGLVHVMLLPTVLHNGSPKSVPACVASLTASCLVLADLCKPSRIVKASEAEAARVNNVFSSYNFNSSAFRSCVANVRAPVLYNGQ